MDLSIIIVNWNSAGYLRKCIASILAETQELQYEVVVIDAGSYDGCDQMIREHYPQVRFIQNPSNPGFARANNKAFKASTGNCLLFLNPDTELVGPAVNVLYGRWQALPRAGIVGCRLLNTDRTLQTSCVQSFPTIANQVLDSEFLRRHFPLSQLWGTAALFAEGAEAYKVDVISGACMLVSRSLFESVGCFTEDYFMYSEDVDLCYKSARHGYQNYYIPSATIVHHGGSSSVKSGINFFSPVMMRESRWRFFTKTRGRFYALGYRLGMALSALGRFLLLGLGAILKVAGQGRTSIRPSFNKWWAILRWSLGLENWLKKYS